ncbi:MAG: hypothetical protein Q9174_007399, partial [Haloplaca sp. 1 TL-2023]
TQTPKLAKQILDLLQICPLSPFVVIMLNKQALVALAAYLTTLPLAQAGVPDMTPPLALCKEVYNTEDVLDVGEFEAAEGGGTSVFMDIFEPDKGCAVVVRSPASTDEVGCGYIVGSFRNAVCTSIALKETFIVQHCCGSAECEDAGAGAKMIRGLDYKRDVPTNDQQVKKKDGTIVQPAQVGEPPAKRAVAEARDVPTNNQEVRKKDGTIVQPAQVGEPPAKRAYPETGGRKPKKLVRRDGLHDDCSDYVQEKPEEDDYYTRPDERTQIVATVLSSTFPPFPSRQIQTQLMQCRTSRAVRRVAKSPSPQSALLRNPIP